MSAPLVRTFVQRIEAPSERVFPLLCPVREGDWLDGWAEHCQIVWSVSGLAEQGCVFRTFGHGPEATWLITDHDPDAHRIKFVRVVTGHEATTLDIAVRPANGRASSVDIRYVITPIGPGAAVWAAGRYAEDVFRADIAWWEQSMHHYLATGALLRRPVEGSW